MVTNPPHATDGGPAYPVSFRIPKRDKDGNPTKDAANRNEYIDITYPGMTLWDQYFNGAMTGMAPEVHAQIEEILDKCGDNDGDNQAVNRVLGRATFIAASMADMAISHRVQRHMVREQSFAQSQQAKSNGQETPRIVYPDEDK